MSYCVNCGVELDQTASACPLCHTNVVHPNVAIDRTSPSPFPTQRGEVPPVSRFELAILITAMLLSVGLCCGLLNIFLHGGRIWSLYVIGAAVMLWIWFVPPLLMPGIHLLPRLLLDVAAIGIYVFLISVDLNGRDWFLHLALPIILLAGANVLVLGLIFRGGKRSILSRVTSIIGAIGTFIFGIELFLDQYFQGKWQPSWSIVILAICVAMVIPLIIVRRVPSLREEARRRFHM